MEEELKDIEGSTSSDEFEKDTTIIIRIRDFHNAPIFLGPEEIRDKFIKKMLRDVIYSQTPANIFREEDAKTEYIGLDRLRRHGFDLQVYLYSPSKVADNSYVSVLFTGDNSAFKGNFVISVIDSLNTNRFFKSFTMQPWITSYVSREKLLSDPEEFLPEDLLTLQMDVHLERNSEAVNKWHPFSSVSFYKRNHLVVRSLYNSFYFDGLDPDSFCDTSWDVFKSLKIELLLDSPLAECLSRESEVFRAMSDLPVSKMEMEKIAVNEKERVPFMIISCLLMEINDIPFNSVFDIFEVYVAAEKYSIVYVMETCTIFLKLYASIHGMGELHGCVIKQYTNDHLRELLERLIVQVRETNFDEEMIKTNEDVTIKAPIRNHVWVYPYAYSLTFYDKNSLESYVSEEKTCEYDFFK